MTVSIDTHAFLILVERETDEARERKLVHVKDLDTRCLAANQAEIENPGFTAKKVFRLDGVITGRCGRCGGFVYKGETVRSRFDRLSGTESLRCEHCQ